MYFFPSRQGFIWSHSFLQFHESFWAASEVRLQGGTGLKQTSLTSIQELLHLVLTHLISADVEISNHQSEPESGAVDLFLFGEGQNKFIVTADQDV